jgi:hypothetical protein
MPNTDNINEACFLISGRNFFPSYEVTQYYNKCAWAAQNNRRPCVAHEIRTPGVKSIIFFSGLGNRKF